MAMPVNIHSGWPSSRVLQIPLSSRCRRPMLASPPPWPSPSRHHVGCPAESPNAWADIQGTSLTSLAPSRLLGTFLGLGSVVAHTIQLTPRPPPTSGWILNRDMERFGNQLGIPKWPIRRISQQRGPSKPRVENTRGTRRPTSLCKKQGSSNLVNKIGNSAGVPRSRYRSRVSTDT